MPHSPPLEVKPRSAAPFAMMPALAGADQANEHAPRSALRSSTVQPVGHDRLDDQLDSVLPQIKGIVGLGVLGRCQVERLDADPVSHPRRPLRRSRNPG